MQTIAPELSKTYAILFATDTSMKQRRKKYGELESPIEARKLGGGSSMKDLTDEDKHLETLLILTTTRIGIQSMIKYLDPCLQKKCCNIPSSPYMRRDCGVCALTWTLATQRIYKHLGGINVTAPTTIHSGPSSHLEH